MLHIHHEARQLTFHDAFYQRIQPHLKRQVGKLRFFKILSFDLLTLNLLGEGLNSYHAPCVFFLE